MSFTVAALLGLTLAQPAGPDYVAWKSKNLTIPIAYTPEQRSGIGHVELYASADRGQTWPLVAKVLPNQDKFVYVAPKDGLYWFHIVIVDRQGRRDPPNLTAEPPAMKVLIDTTPPVVTITNTRRNGEQVSVEWRIEDEFANDLATEVWYRPVPVPGMPDVWSKVLLDKLPPGARNGVKFPTRTTDPIQVRVMAVDLVGNFTVATRDVPGADGSTAAVTANPPAPTAPNDLVTPVSGPGAGFPGNPPLAPPINIGVNPPPPAPSFPAPGPGPLPVTPPAQPPAPIVAPAPQPSAPVQQQYTTPTQPPYTPPVQPAYPAPAQPTFPPVVSAPTTPAAPDIALPSGGQVPLVVTNPPPVNPAPSPMTTGPAPVEVFDPRQPLTPVAPNAQPTPASPYPQSQSATDSTRAQHVKSFKFDLNYAVNTRGPSGIKRIDLWVTRDDGQNWVLCSQHPATDGVVRVDLKATLRNPPEGPYGFRLVPWSGAGIGDAPPASGDAPDIRVVIDTVDPVLQLLIPTSDPADPGALLLHWQASDANLADDPITLEWSEKQTGPWQSVGAPGSDGLVQVRASGQGTAVRLPNTGNYSWRVPPGTPPHVYLRITARDAAGNVTEKVTRNPLLVDLTKPRVKITGVGMGTIRP